MSSSWHPHFWDGLGADWAVGGASNLPRKTKKKLDYYQYTYYDYHNYLFDVPRFQSCLAVLYKLRVVFMQTND